MQRRILLLLVFASIVSVPLHACWRMPDKIEWLSVAGGRFVLRLDNEKGVVHLYRKRTDPKPPLWTISLSEHSPLHSEIYLNESGTMLIHLRGNHLIDNVDQVAVEIFHRDGRRFRIPAGDFVYDLVCHHGNRRISTAPDLYWNYGLKTLLLNKHTLADSPHLALTTATNRTAIIDLEHGTVWVDGSAQWSDLTSYRCIARWHNHLPYLAGGMLILAAWWVAGLRKRCRKRKARQPRALRVTACESPLAQVDAAR